MKVPIGILVVLLFLICSRTWAGSLWVDIAKQRNIDPYELYAIALVESRRVWTDGQVRPWPYTLMIQGKKSASVFMPDQESATTLLTLLLENGIDNVDVCCMQINLRTHIGRVKEPTQLFNLKKCIETGADILVEALQSTTDHELGLGRYHHWKNENVSREYGKKIVALSQSLHKTGLFGNDAE